MFCLNFFFLAILVLFGSLNAQEPDYCASGLCPNGGTNVCCNSTGTFASTCPPNVTLVTITPELQAAILDSHNEKRNTLAAGNLTNFTSASRMGTMKWSTDLAKTANCSCLECSQTQKKCSNTVDNPNTGANVGRITTPPARTVEFSILRLLDVFWSRYENANNDDVSSYPADTNGRNINPFLVMAIQNNSVACCMTEFIDPETDRPMRNMTCNYAQNVTEGDAIYENGTTASECTTGTNPDYPSLCSDDEYTVT